MDEIYSGKLSEKPTCPYCQSTLDGFTHIGGVATPKPDDITVCAYCRSVLQFTKDMTLMEADADVVAQVDLVKLGMYQEAVKEVTNV